MPPVQQAPSRHWCGTINHYRLNERPIKHVPRDLSYAVCGSEVGENGVPHLQIYVVCNKKMRLTALRKLMPRAHLEIMRGTPKQASDYCKKDGYFWEEGDFPITAGESQQDKWKEIHTLAKANDTNRFYEEHAQVSFLHAKKFDDLVDHYKAKLVPLPIIDARWYMGPSGSGKSLAARTEFPDFYLKPTATKWWPKYNRQDTVLLDDLGKTHGYMLEALKNWADHYPFTAETKGGHTGLIRPVRIIVTTQYHWNELTEDKELRAAIARRFVLREFAAPAGQVEPLDMDFIYPYGGFGQQEDPLLDDPSLFEGLGEEF